MSALLAADEIPTAEAKRRRDQVTTWGADDGLFTMFKKRMVRIPCLDRLR